MKECISGVAFADVVISTFFGFDPSLDGKTILADPQMPRPFTGKLLHVSSREGEATISADEQGLHLRKE